MCGNLLVDYHCCYLSSGTLNWRTKYCRTKSSFRSVLWHCWLGDRKGIQPVKSWVLVCWWWWFDWSFARLIAPVVTTTSVILCSNKIQNGDILVPVNPGPPGKWLLNRRQRKSYGNVIDQEPLLEDNALAWRRSCDDSIDKYAPQSR